MDGMGLEWVVVVFILLMFFLFWLVTFFNILKADFKDPMHRLVFIFVIVFLPLLGLIIYWILRGGLINRSSPSNEPVRESSSIGKLKDLDDELYEDGWQQID